MLRIFIHGVIAQYLQFSLSGMICTVFNNLRKKERLCELVVIFHAVVLESTMKYMLAAHATR